MPTTRPSSSRAEARLDEPLLLEGIADLHAGPLGRLLLGLAEAGRGEHAHAADAVAAGGGAEQHRQVADAGRLAPSTSRSVGMTPDAQHVDQRVVGVALVEDELAADRRHADGVAVAGDAR